MARTHYRTCNLCEAMCGIAIEAEGDQVLSIRGDEHDPFSRGHICPKAAALKDIHEDPDRLRVPQRRVGDRWEPIGWDEAFDEIAARLLDIQKRHGNNAVAVYQGNPTVHNHGSLIFAQVFIRALDTRNRYSATSLDQLPHMLSALEMFGHQLMLPVPDIDRTEYFLIFGGNPVVSNGSLMSAPDVKKRLRAIQTRGGKVVVVDPRRTETAEIADQHVFVLPGADVFLLLAMLQVLLQEHSAKLGHAASFVDGVAEIEGLVAGYTPEAVASITGVDPNTTRQLVADFVAAPSAVCYGRVGVATQEFGTLCTWLINVFNILTGNFDAPGGAMFTTPAIDLVSSASRFGEAGHFDKGRSRVRGLPEFGGEYPTATLAEEIETPGDGQIRALVTSAGNPVLSAPNGRRLDSALETLELMVAVDIYRNETTRHAHFILPPTFTLEHSHYDLALHLLQIRNTTKYSPALFDKPPEARHDWEIFVELARRIMTKRKLPRLLAPLERAAVQLADPDRILDIGLRFGPYGAGVMPGKDGLTLAKVKAEPHGIDLGPLVSCLPDRLNTPDKRVALAPPRITGDLPRAKLKLDAHSAEGNGTLQLIGRRELRSNNSWMHNSERLVKGKMRCTLLIHPADAQSRGIADGDQVRVASRVGELGATVEISEAMMQGVVSLPHGWGHDRKGAQLRVAQGRPGISINDLTDEQHIDALSGNIHFNGVPVTVSGESTEG